MYLWNASKVGTVLLSLAKIKRAGEAWTVLEKAYEAEERVTGVIFGRVKGGFTVDLSGAVAFLPGSQVDIRPIRDVAPLMEIRSSSRFLNGSEPRQYCRIPQGSFGRNPRGRAL